MVGGQHRFFDLVRVVFSTYVSSIALAIGL